MSKTPPSQWIVHFDPPRAPYLLSSEAYGLLGYANHRNLCHCLARLCKKRKLLVGDACQIGGTDRWKISVAVLHRVVNPRQMLVPLARLELALPRLKTVAWGAARTHSHHFELHVSKDGRQVRVAVAQPVQQELPLPSPKAQEAKTEPVLSTHEARVEALLQQWLETVKTAIEPLLQMVEVSTGTKQRLDKLLEDTVRVLPTSQFISSRQAVERLAERCGKDKHGKYFRGPFGTEGYSYRELTPARLYLLARRAGINLNRIKVANPAFGENRYEFEWTESLLDKVAPQVSAWYRLRTPRMKRICEKPQIYDWDYVDVTRRMLSIPGVTSEVMGAFLTKVLTRTPRVSLPTKEPLRSAPGIDLELHISAEAS